MGEWTLGAIESRFADIIWQRAPLSTTELVSLAETELNWKRTTTYTVLKRLCNRGIFQNQKGIVSVVISREKFYALKSEEFVKESFGGSLPAFLEAFIRRAQLSDEDIERIQQIIDKK